MLCTGQRFAVRSTQAAGGSHQGTGEPFFCRRQVQYAEPSLGDDLLHNLSIRNPFLFPTCHDLFIHRCSQPHDAIGLVQRRQRVQASQDDERRGIYDELQEETSTQ